ncbi:MAG: hypothetical protein HOL85_01050, partial [Rhodospirillaceae bacterium]|nr:hypothetical protein [Rhodospirillaceae bacterium]
IPARRQHALHTHRVFAGVLPYFTNRIDCGEPLVQSLSDFLGVKLKIIKWLRHIDDEMAIRVVERFPGAKLIQFCSWLARADRKTSGFNNRGLGPFISGNRFLDELAREYGLDDWSLAEGAWGNWSEVANYVPPCQSYQPSALVGRLGLSAPAIDFWRLVIAPEILRAIEGEGVGFTPSRIWQCLTPSAEEQILVGQMFQPNWVRRFVERYLNWACSIRHPASAAEDFDELTDLAERIGGTTALLDEPIAIDDRVQGVSLFTPTDLFAEHRILLNAAPKLLIALRYTPRHAISLRTVGGRPIATVILRDQDRRLRLERILYPFRKDPPIGASQLAHILVARINDSNSAIPWDRIENDRCARWDAAAWDLTSSMFGLPIHLDDALDWVFQLYHRRLGHLRDPRFETRTAALAAVNLSQFIVPRLSASRTPDKMDSKLIEVCYDRY